MDRDIKIYLTLVVMVVLIVAGIYYWKNQSQLTPEEQTMKCIASKVVLYSQEDCPRCKQQKDILGEYINLFNIIECDKQTDLCIKEEITGTPSWKINGKLYLGVKSIKELSDLTGCECNANINVVKNTSIENCNINTEQECTTPVDNICA